MPRIIKYLPLAILSILLFTACGKKEKDKKAKSDKNGAVTATLKVGSNSPYHFKYNPVINSAYLSGPNQEGLYNLKMTFVEVMPSKTINFLAYIKGEGTYHFDEESFEGGEGYLSIMLQWEDESDSTSIYYTFPITNDPLIGNATLKITSLTEDRMKGTFSGTLYTMTGEKAVIEEGKFDVGVNRN